MSQQRLTLPARATATLLASLVLPAFARAQSGQDITQLSLEQLAQAHITVSSVGRKEEDLWKTPAAVFVITRAEIEQSGASSIPELLRMVPGVQVAQIDASTWAISVRGFNSDHSNKVLVLIDGRSIYTEVFSGTQWDQNDLPLDNVERVEVVRGPGAVAWGSDAVNGVINIITRRARATQGLDLSATASRVEETALLRYGGSLHDRIQYTGFFHYLNRTPLLTATGSEAFDGEDTFRGGGVVDWRRNAVDTFTLDGDLYTGRLKQQIVSTVDLDLGPGHREHESIAGGHLLGRWERKSPSSSDLALQVYFDDQSRHELLNNIRTRSFSADLQNHLSAGSRNDLVLGARFRLTRDRFQGNVLVDSHPAYTDYLLDAFAQDEMSLLPHRVNLTLGSKIENGTLAGFQLQPSARILYTPSENQSLWAAVSRAVVAPSLQDTQLSLPLSLGSEDGLPVLGQFLGDPGYRPEKVIAYEAGSRTRVGRSFSVDLAAFLNRNTRVQSLSVGPLILVPGSSPTLFTTLLYTNGFDASTGGIEASLTWKPRSNLLFGTGYAWLQAHTTQVLPGLVFLVDAWNSPRHTVTESFSWSPAPRWNAGGFFNFVGWLPPAPGAVAAPTQGGSASFTPAYSRLDLHLSRKLPHSFQVEAGGTNLLSGRHLEFGSSSSLSLPTYIPRSASFKLAWNY